MSEIQILVGAVVALISGLMPSIIMAHRYLRRRRMFKSRSVLFGIIGLSNYPRILRDLHLREFSNPDQFRKSGLSVGVLVCRSLSYALRHCDYVVADTSTDVKVINPGDKEALLAVLDGLDFSDIEAFTKGVSDG